MRLLIAEDDRLLGTAVQISLGRTGLAVDWVQTGSDFNLSVSTHSYDLILLDLGLPDQDGAEILKQVRLKQPNLPVIVMTARGSVFDRIAVLDLGADDYLVKPFDIDELTARVRCVLRRVRPEDGNEGALCYGPLRLCPLRQSATWNGEPVPLTPREFRVLEMLVRKRNQIVSRAQLEESLYGWGEEVESNAIEVHVHYLRRKLPPEVIQTIRGMGYQLASLH